MAGVLVATAVRQFQPLFARLRKTGRVNVLLSLLAVAALVAYGGSKPAESLSIGGKSSLSRQYSCSAMSDAFFSVSCNRQWSVSVDVPWITFSAAGTSGGDGKVTYSLEENTGAQRVGKITVKCGAVTCVCKVTQDKPLLIAGKTSMSRAYSTDEQNDCYFTVTCSQSPWTAKSSASWVTLKTTGGTGTTKLYYDVAENPSVVRTATITVTSRGLSRVCTIKQDGFTIPATVLTIGGKTSLSRQYSCEALEDAYFSIASDGSWSVTSSADWIKAAPPDGVGDGRVTYMLDENKGTSQRTGKITVESGSLMRTCTIKQDKPLLIGGKTSMLRTYESARQADCYFSVTCSQSPWTAVSSAPWVTVKTASGTGTTKLYYDIVANTSSSGRTATIKVTSRGLTRTCTIYQKGK